MNRQTFARSTIAVAILVAVTGVYVHSNGTVTPISNANAAVFPTAPLTTPPAAAPMTSGITATATDFSSIVERAGPAVVNISVTGSAKATPASENNTPQLDPNDPLSQFFKRFGPQLQMPHQPGPQIMRGLGSGFIISSDGLILTNAHVVDGAQEVTVKLTDRREFKAKVLGSDKQSDIAVIRIDAKNLPTVQIGNPAQTRVGEPVLAIGSPYGFENTATAGIVSAKSRSLPDDNYVPFIQTDVAVNPGNSGGPLFNIKGQVIGINSQIYSQTGGYQGLSFSIPIDVAMHVEQQLVQHGKVTRGHLGVSVQEVNQALAVSFGLPKAEGALVGSVEKNGPAEKGGLETGDVILRFNGQAINRSADLPEFVADSKPGSTVTVDVVRHGTAKTLSFKVGEMTPNKVASNDTANGEQGRLGLAVRPLNQDERQQAGVSGGLVVGEASGPSALAGIQAGDVILSINGKPVSSAEQLRQLANKAGKNVALLVQRDGQKIFVPLTLG
ncbi:DegQ family serine endoprotease [Glaciimonas immobilis]|uniref:Probable periplasmic serine endoprotease DegP-like n=1 Tax=Glaciimonas immobilis TaxID=728004 RepID=A0A840S0D3_9BURK|nr:DegQ family serine endoprotease [Glaciimonas immobilis]KAF3996353.1 DegQ family serine endoprotease [Glaciimonas immobilis]MBB5202191.1 serine protease Do [Glaciimonas immobilis]